MRLFGLKSNLFRPVMVPQFQTIANTKQSFNYLTFKNKIIVYEIEKKILTPAP